MRDRKARTRRVTVIGAVFECLGPDRRRTRQRKRSVVFRRSACRRAAVGRVADRRSIRRSIQTHRHRIRVTASVGADRRCYHGRGFRDDFLVGEGDGGELPTADRDGLWGRWLEACDGAERQVVGAW